MSENTATNEITLSRYGEPESDWESRRAVAIEEAKAKLRKLVAGGFYPLAQLSGRPCVAVGEPM